MALLPPLSVRTLLRQLEQELASIESPSLSLPLGLLASVCAVVVIAALLLQSSGAKQRRSTSDTGKTRAADAQHAMAAPATHAGSANGIAQLDDKLAVAAELPSPEQLSKLISTRRSIFPKDYNCEVVPESDIQLMLEAANWAPTHGKTEPWRFVVLDRAAAVDLVDKSIEISKTKLSPEEFGTKRAKKAEMMKQKKIPRMSHVILLNLKRVPSPGSGKMMPEWEDMAAVSCAVQNMQLMATSLDVACYWSSWWEEVRESPEFKAWAGLESGDCCLGTLMVGKSDNPGAYRASRGSVADKVEWRRNGLANGHKITQL